MSLCFHFSFISTVDDRWICLWQVYLHLVMSGMWNYRRCCSQWIFIRLSRSENSSICQPDDDESGSRKSLYTGWLGSFPYFAGARWNIRRLVQQAIIYVYYSWYSWINFIETGRCMMTIFTRGHDTKDGVCKCRRRVVRMFPFYRVWISVLPFFHRRRHHPQLCPDDRTRGSKLARNICMLLRVGIGDTSFNPGGTRHASLALARNRDVIYVASVNWYIFVSTTHLNHGKCYTVYIHIHITHTSTADS